MEHLDPDVALGTRMCPWGPGCVTADMSGALGSRILPWRPGCGHGDPDVALGSWWSVTGCQWSRGEPPQCHSGLIDSHQMTEPTPLSVNGD